MDDEEEGGIYTLAWTCNQRRYLYDSDNPMYVHMVAVRLAEQGREDVQIIGPRTIEIPPGLVADIRARVERRVKVNAEYERLKAMVDG